MENLPYFDQFEDGTGNNNIFYAAALYAQARHESGNFTSNIYLNTNNCFGMKQPKVRPTTSLGGWTGSNGTIWANYSSIVSAVEDRVLWDNYFQIQPPESARDIQRYFNDIQSKGYAEDPQYVQLVMNIANNIFNEFKDFENEPIMESETKQSIFSSATFWIYAIVAFVVFTIIFKKKKTVKRYYKRARTYYRKSRNRYRTAKRQIRKRYVMYRRKRYRKNLRIYR